MIRGLRGAVTIASDTPELVWEESVKLTLKVAEENNVKPENIASIIISTTPDITSAFPAKSIRLMEDWQYVPIMCMHEMNVDGALPLCIRVLIHANTNIPQHEIKHIYLNDAVKLRPDLVHND